MRTFLAIVFVFFFVSGALSQPVAERILPEQGYLPGQYVMISIMVTGEAEDLTIVETPPTGWAIGGVTSSSYATTSEGVITWRMASFSSPLRLRYAVTPPYSAVGDAVFTGTINDANIGGDTTWAPHTQRALEPIGIFQDHIDIGPVTSGSAAYEDGVYVIIGSAEDGKAWGHYAYSVVEGSVSLKAKMSAETTLEIWGAVIAFLQNTSNDAVYYSAQVTTDGQVVVYCKYPSHSSGPDVNTWSTRLPPENQDGEIKLVRQGDTVSTYYFNTKTQAWTLYDTRIYHFTDPFYACIGA